MASLNTLRTKFGAVLSVIIALALLAFILSLKADMGFSDNDPKVGEIDGDKIRYSEYMDRYDAVKSRNGGMEASTDQESDQMAAATWQALFADHVLVPGFEQMGIEVPESERLEMVSGRIPSQAFFAAFGDPRTGAYNAAAVSQFLSQAAADARAQQAWNDLNEQAKLERAVQKYATLIGKGAYVNKLEIEEGVAAANKVFGGKYVGKRYDTVPDSLVSVSSGEIKSYYNAHKEMFRQSPSRTMSYVVFEVNATDDDMLNLEKEVRGVGERFDAAEDVKLFVRQDRHGQIADRYVTAAQLGEQAEALAAGRMFGPELKNNVWTMARVVESRMAPDTLGLKMIVLPYTAEKLADSLRTVATSANFADLSRRYSANEELAAAGGEVGVYPFSAFNSTMAEALADAKKGDVVKVMSGDAIQLINVYRADKPSKHYKVATVSYPVEASAATVRDIHNQASSFAVNAKGSDAAFSEAASKAAVTPRVATLNMGDRAIRGLEGSREVARWAYGADEGDLSEIFRIGKDYVVALLTEIDDDDYASVKKAAPRIKNRLMRDKKYEYIVKNLSDASLEGAAGSFGSEVADFKDVTFGSFYIDGVGVEPALVGAIAETTAQGEVSAPVKGLSGVYLFEVTSVDPAERQQTVEDEKVRAEAMAEGMMQQRVLPALQEMADMKDLSGRYF
ncbi:peptidylprolyl isomerase [Alistipes sp.]|uniref:peptidylprolyl isomerase n=1 Tax=Alistipes sp. TaxID=1872444 RepID=UPI003A89D31D